MALRTWFKAGLDTAGVTVGFDDLRGLFQLKWLYGSYNSVVLFPALAAIHVFWELQKATNISVNKLNSLFILLLSWGCVVWPPWSKAVWSMLSCTPISLLVSVCTFISTHQHFSWHQSRVQLWGTLMWCGTHLINRGSHVHRWRALNFKMVQARDCSLGRLSQLCRLHRGEKVSSDTTKT